MGTPAEILKQRWMILAVTGVLIAVANYPLWGKATEKFYAPGPALSVCLKEQKLPPVRE